MEREYSVKRFHTFHYKKLSNGTFPYKPIQIKFWLWGFGMCVETKKRIWGVAINSIKVTLNSKADSYTQEYHQKIHKKS